MTRSIDVLIIDDNLADIRLIERTFDELHCNARVHLALDGQEGVEKVLSLAAGTRPDLILLDLNLPRLSGIEVLRRIRSDPRVAAVPVVVFTSSSSESDVGAAYEAGASAFVTKPMDFEGFLQAIETACRFWIETNHYPPRATG